MKIMRFFLFAGLLFLASTASAQETFLRADAVYKDAYAEYPKERFIVGVGLADGTGRVVRDKRIAEVRARLEIAKYIGVRVEEEIIDVVCEGKTAAAGAEDCRTEYRSISRETVDEFLKGSRIVKTSDAGGLVYAIAVLPRAEIAEGLDRNLSESLNEVNEGIRKARQGDREAAYEAGQALKKAVVYDKEREFIGGIKSKASGMFDELERQLIKLREKQ